MINIRPTYTLIDGVVTNVHHPDTFEIPTFQEIARLQPGHYIKIGVTFNPHLKIGDDTPSAELIESTYRSFKGERFWLLLTAIKGRTFTGKIANELVYTGNHGLKYDDELIVERRHILAIT